MAKHLIIGGAGFIGSNLAFYLLSQGEEVIVADNLSRRGSEHNLSWLQETYQQLRFAHCDIRQQAETDALLHSNPPVNAVYHLAAQVAVTTSVKEPRLDFNINALGTFNVLESLRQLDSPPVLIFASTNKVYGGMEHIRIAENETRYYYEDYPEGIDESFPLDFHSPYGCSKGCADQYVRDYSRIYGLKTVVFRQSAIYGPRQFGVEDQGWAAWFAIAALKGKPFTIYGDGKQVRDLLWVEDLIQAYLKAYEAVKNNGSMVFNIGGGTKHSVSIWREFQPVLSKETGLALETAYKDWRPGDQKVCIMNNQKVSNELGWEPKVGVEEGVAKMVQWIKENQEIL